MVGTTVTFDPHVYGPAAARFLLREQPAAELERCTAAELFDGSPLPREALSGLWLFFDELDRSHALSQDLPSREGSFWHGIMHRREPDPANAAYWFRRVGPHAIFPALAEAAAAAGFASGRGAEWDPFAWIDYWEEARRKPGSSQYAIALEVQCVEWELLFDYCARPKTK